MAYFVGKDGDYTGNTAELIGLSGCEACREAHGGTFIGVEDFRRVLGNGSDDGGVPMVVGGENTGLIGFGNVNDESFMTIGLDGNGHRSEAERDNNEKEWKNGN